MNLICFSKNVPIYSSMSYSNNGDDEDSNSVDLLFHKSSSPFTLCRYEIGMPVHCFFFSVLNMPIICK